MILHMTEEEYASFIAQRYAGKRGNRPIANISGDHNVKRQKYGNRKVTVDGMKFDSQHEANYYFHVLLPRVRSGELMCVCRQVPFDLPGGVRYIADYIAIRPDMTIEAVIDAKSDATRKDKTYIIKKKQMLACNGIEIQEV